MIFGATAWIVALGALLVSYLRPRRSLGAGLVLSYFGVFFVMHAVPGLILFLPWFESADPDADRAGFIQSAIGALAFSGAAIAFFRLEGRAPKRGTNMPLEIMASTPASRDPSVIAPPREDVIHPGIWLLTGLLVYLVIRPLAGGVPTMTALLSMAGLLVVVGICLLWLRHRLRQDRVLARLWIASAAVLPFGTMLIEGFLGFGTAMLIIVLCFVASIHRPRWILAVGAAGAVYLLFSLYITYMVHRSDIRASVWEGEPLESRARTVGEALAGFQWLDPFDPVHLDIVEGRLNQNRLVGAAVQNLSVTGAYANGETIFRAVLAVVPRALWPDKPIRAGSEGLVSEYTGIPFAGGTSVGMGQVFEFYINFGTLGVIVGFVIFGTAMSFLDLRAADRLRNGDWNGFVKFFLPGLGLLQAGGSLVETSASSAAGFIVAAGLVWLLGKRRPTEQVLPSHIKL